MYEFAAIMGYEEAQEAHPLLPRFGPDHKVAPEPGEQFLASAVATGLALYRGEALRSEWVSLMLDSDRCYFQVSDVPVTVALTSKRVIVVCERFEKGGGWRGSAGLMLTANALSKARAAMHTRGKVLAGQMRLPWLSRVGYHDRHSRKSTNALRLVACDTDGTQVMAVITLGKDSSPRAFTKQVFQAAVAERQAAPERLEPQRLARLSRRLPQYETDSGKLAFHDIPGALSPTTRPASPGAAV
jgi:hypothetical protein